MRLLLAAFFAVLLSFCWFAIFFASGWLWRPTLPVMLIFATSWLLLIFLTYFLFRPRIPGLAELQRAGLVEETPFRVLRAFGIEDYNDEGPHYFLKLDDGRTIYFVGQYLYDYEPIDDETDWKQPRQFPCTEFTLVRHRKTGEILGMRFGGTALEPELVIHVEEPFLVLRRLLGHTPKDGELVSLLDYESLRERIRDNSE